MREWKEGKREIGDGRVKIGRRKERTLSLSLPFPQNPSDAPEGREVILYSDPLKSRRRRRESSDLLASETQLKRVHS